MRKAIIFTFALSLFALPMSLHASPPAKSDASTKIIKPLSAMKSTIASPSKATADSTKAGATTEKAIEKKADAAKKMAEDAGKDEAKKVVKH